MVCPVVLKETEEDILRKNAIGGWVLPYGGGNRAGALIGRGEGGSTGMKQQ